MKRRLVYVSQFRAACGYAVAARGYLRSLEKHLQNNPDSFDLKKDFQKMILNIVQ